MLPDELLHSTVEYIAYTPEPPDCDFLGFHFKSVSPALLSLSQVNRRMRRICVPFLFSYLRVVNVAEAMKLMDLCRTGSIIPSLIRVLLLSASYYAQKEGHKILRQVLPCLHHLSCIHLRIPRPSIDLFTTVLEQPTVSTVLMRSLDNLPGGFSKLNLSKLVLKHTSVAFPRFSTLETCIRRGARMASLDIHRPDLLDESFGPRIFTGLQELNLFVCYFPVSFSWLPAFASGHPSLNKMWLLDDKKHYFDRHTPYFIHSFVEGCHRQELSECFDITRVGLSRVNQSSQEWRVTGMTIVTKFASTSLIEILSLICSSFPAIEVLSFDLDRHKDTYHIDDIVSVLAGFSCLRVLYISHLYNRIESGRKTSWKLVRQLETNDVCKILAATAESAFLCYASRLAKEIASLAALHIDDMGYEHEKSRYGRRWWLKGWLHVRDSSRDIEGALRILTDY
ncbi:hypothetical protein DFJ43DRAFT_1157636 [Lentinula guzmanii]|uniref:Uncharacterized protein n=1 Tax=Lentinula guzmanii TaxID=2804957 RepID=A0AA38J6K6_9AGAR|nr:hypothetical protein DFJ43DRAFT_1157636 [Lentinula guzmanii]